jgi:hypothetical protein
MKTISSLTMIAIGLAIVFSSCDKTAGARYIDLSTGKEVKLEKDEATGLWVNVETKKPVYIYVDTKTNDTIYGSTGKVINGSIVRLESGDYRYTGDYEYKNGDYKVEVEKDGDLKIKDGDSKIKVDGETGEKKVKHDD